MRCATLRIVGISAFLGGGLIGTWTGQAEAQMFGRRPGRVVVNETIVSPPVVVAPAPVVVAPARVPVWTYHDYYRVRGRRGVVAYPPTVLAAPPVYTETRLVQPAPIVERRVVQPAPVVERRVVQPPPVVEERVVQPPAIEEVRIIRPNPVIESTVVPLPR